MMKNSKEQEGAHKQFIENVNKLEQSLEDLRILVKYQTFDLEATRRENEQLRKLLEKQDQN